jgi:hypothetical protein
MSALAFAKSHLHLCQWMQNMQKIYASCAKQSAMNALRNVECLIRMIIAKSALLSARLAQMNVK